MVQDEYMVMVNMGGDEGEQNEEGAYNEQDGGDG